MIWERRVRTYASYDRQCQCYALPPKAIGCVIKVAENLERIFVKRVQRVLVNFSTESTSADD